MMDLKKKETRGKNQAHSAVRIELEEKEASGKKHLHNFAII